MCPIVIGIEVNDNGICSGEFEPFEFQKRLKIFIGKPFRLFNHGFDEPFLVQLPCTFELAASIESLICILERLAIYDF